MQYSLAKLIYAIAIAAVFFGAIRSIDTIGPMCLPIGLLLLLCSGIAYPLTILSSPQRGTQLDPSSNAVWPYVHLLAGVAAVMLVLFMIFFVSNPFGYFYR